MQTRTEPVPDPFRRVERWIASLRRRLDRTALGEASWGALLALIPAALGALLFASLLGAGPGRWAWALLGVASLACLIGIWRVWWRPRRARAGDEGLARWVEARVEGLHSGVITSVQTAAALRDGATWPGLHPEMARASAEWTCRHLDAVAPETLVDQSNLRRLRRFGVVLLAAASVATWTSQDLLLDGARNLVRPAPAAATAAETEVQVAVGDISFRLIYPAYLDLSPREVSRTRGDVSAVTGTEARLTAVALHPAVDAALILESDPEGRWPVEVDAEGVLQAGFRIGAHDRYQFVLTAPDGVRVRERAWRNIEALPDLAPEVRLLLPEADVEVDPADEVSFVVEVVDDHGLAAVRLMVDQLDGREPSPRPTRSVRGERTARITTALSIAPLDLRPGEAVEVWVEADDLNTVTGPGTGRSARRRISMYSPEAEHAERLVELERLIEELLDVLAERLESPVDERVPARLGIYLTVQQGISQATAETLRAAETLVASLTTDSLASDGMRDAVRELVERLQSHHEGEAAQLRMAFDAVKKLKRLQELGEILYTVNEEGVTELEHAILTLKDLLDESRKERLLDQGRELLDAQHDLMEMLKKLGEQGGDTGEAERLLDDLEQNLRRMEAELRKLAERTPYENQNLNVEPSDTEVDMKSIRDRLAEVRELMKEGRIEEAMKLLEELNRATQEMMAALHNDMGPMNRIAAETRKRLHDFTMKQQEISDGQRGLLEETGEADRRMSERQRREMAERMEEAVESARDKAKALEEKLAEAPREPLHPADQEALSELRQRAEHLKEAVERQELEQAREQAQSLGGQCDKLGGEVGESESRELDLDKARGMRAAREQLGEGAEMASELAGDLDELLEKLRGQSASGEERRQASQLERRQGELGRELSELEGGLDELEGQLPGIKEQVGPKLGEAGEEMQQAGERLGEAKPGEAARHQRAALERLGEAQRSIERRLQESSREDQRDDGVGINDPRRRVEIPEGDDYGAPERFRQELLDAMKERAPERFKESIERYYEELVR